MIRPGNTRRPANLLTAPWRRFRPAGRLALLVMLLVPAPASAGPITITADRVEYFHLGSSSHSAGRLTFMGGLELSSPDPDFGGLSGLRFSADGSRFYAVSDNAHWLTGKLVRDSGGRLTGLEDTDYSCICRQDGQPYGSKHWGDAEAVEVAGDRVYIGFERLNRINGYDLTDTFGLGPPAQATTSLKSLNIDYSDGIEAIALIPDGLPHAGRFLVITEKSLNAAGNNRAFVVDAKTTSEFSVTRSDEYSITDATFTPQGDLLVIERRFGLSIGIGIRIRRFDWRAAADGESIKRPLAGEVLLEAGLGSRIDNMEGITAWRDETGRSRIAIVSDDNYARIQRTLLLEFRLEE